MQVRIGNDITIRATVLRLGEAEDFSGKTLRLILRSPYERIELPFTVSGNTLTALWPGSSQTKTGRYTLTLIEEATDGSGSKFTTDECGVLELVPTACPQCGCNTTSTALTGAQTLDIDLNVTLPANGLSAYEIAVKNGYEGTEEEWLKEVEAGVETVEKLNTRIDTLEKTIENLGEGKTATLGERSVTLYAGGAIIDLGTCTNDEASDFAARAEIAGNALYSLIIWHTENGTAGRILNVPTGENEMCYQYMFRGYSAYIRGVTGANGVEGNYTNAYGWELYGAQRLAYDESTSQLTLADYCNNALSTVTIAAGASGSGDSGSSLEDLAFVLQKKAGWIIKIKAGTTCLYTTNDTDEDKWYRESGYKSMGSTGLGENCLDVAYVSGYGTSMGSMFYNCSSLASLDVSGFDTANVISMYNMFNGCSKLRYITLGANFFKTKQSIPFSGAANLGRNEDGTSNGWMAHLAETAPEITDGTARTLALPSALNALSDTADAVSTLQAKGYTVTF